MWVVDGGSGYGQLLVFQVQWMYGWGWEERFVRKGGKRRHHTTGWCDTNKTSMQHSTRTARAQLAHSTQHNTQHSTQHSTQHIVAQHTVAQCGDRTTPIPYSTQRTHTSAARHIHSFITHRRGRFLNGHLRRRPHLFHSRTNKGRATLEPPLTPPPLSPPAVLPLLGQCG